jgi:ABC-type polysaccharide/polyol phosphate export permease
MLQVPGVSKKMAGNELFLDKALSSHTRTINNKTKMAYEDIKQGILQWRISLLLSYQDIQLRYRRSVLGPFWITISMAITVYTMGLLYANLFHQDLSTYFPFLIGGMLTWTLISSIINEVTDGLAASEGLIKQIKLPYTSYIHRIACRNLIIFFHNIVVIVPILIIYHNTAPINFYTLLIIPGLLLIYVNSIFYGLIISMIGARYRDISQLIKSVLQIIFFITPVMWTPATLGRNHYLLVDLNPIYALIEIIRQPLLGGLPTLKNLIMALIVTILGIVVSSKFFIKYRQRIIFWL